jgi:1-phosphatidylinositol-3-phosphate 5-kinase
MDFSHFIKIKVINYLDNSKSAYINGIVMSKNIADKRMNTLINNPKILLLNNSINTVSSEGASLQTIIDQENDWNAIIKERLTQLKPNIIIVEQDVGYKILDDLR